MKFDMDYIAHHNKLTLMNSYYKIAIAMGLMIITLILNKVRSSENTPLNQLHKPFSDDLIF